jgi:hypothetical protein
MGAREKGEGIVSGEFGVDKFFFLAPDEACDLALERLFEVFAENDLFIFVVAKGADGKLGWARGEVGAIAAVGEEAGALEVVHHLDEFDDPVMEDWLYWAG